MKEIFTTKYWRKLKQIISKSFETKLFCNGTISIISLQFNDRCLLQGNVLINRRYLSLASLPLPMTVTMTLSQ